MAGPIACTAHLRGSSPCAEVRSRRDLTPARPVRDVWLITGAVTAGSVHHMLAMMMHPSTSQLPSLAICLLDHMLSPLPVLPFASLLVVDPPLTIDDIVEGGTTNSAKKAGCDV
eukprot:CAMPEP_0119482246 /NCGR_PEP_ID=MMETSP1344-20130328/10188_1 /TAXON_ID=236787 /ORGANISM="Florenciella parvula, Strain CCMP2471" /LENGTH=113 /DNA_ID=CAMNT_0007516631 /DNA_START=159 /DNA_END=501 /DNA_ORIENTATION=-